MHRSSSWVLMGLTAEPRPLRDVIAYMDALEHAVPLQEELDAGLRELVAAGLAVVDGDRFGLTPAGAELVERASGSTREWQTAFRRVDAALQALADPPALPDWRLSRELYDGAVREYLSS